MLSEYKCIYTLVLPLPHYARAKGWFETIVRIINGIVDIGITQVCAVTSTFELRRKIAAHTNAKLRQKYLFLKTVLGRDK